MKLLFLFLLQQLLDFVAFFFGDAGA